ncbi:hypothetical protein SAMN04488109_4541 [Chryseolinea serpens]|uniref:Aerotolerance regulator N-terminal domain-containing protein n=1 Tax=Chryseolinea serpens TaxID=947013 RepID=A0A1M5U9H6_9BACT|nr:hypothetical protein [Chryseolinea serpens]SHH59617.1 hypothetical protein SAMN04488109_4541 [Chryseolinea serpens]
MITFHALVSPTLLAALLVPLTLLFLWLEWKRKQRFLVLRWIAVVVMMAMAASLFLRPVVTSEKNSSILLLTAGYEKQKVDSLLQHHPDLQLWHLTGVNPYKKSSLLADHELPIKGDQIRFVTGEGLPATDLDLLDNKTFTFIPSQPTAGIMSLSVVQPVLAHHPAQVQGTFYNTTPEKKWIVINGPNGKEDSVLMEGRGLKSFHLSFTPKQKGEWLYTLAIQGSDEKWQAEKLPVYVEADAPLRLLFIQDFPTFETQYLKSYLAHAGHKLILRYQLSQKIFRFEFANRQPTQVNRLTHDVLDETDLLIIDDGALQKLTAGEKNILKESIHSGLGILILPHATKTKRDGLFPFTLAPVKTDSATIVLQDKAVTLPALPVRLQNNSTVQSLVQNKSGILTGYAFSGAGKLGFQLLQETYRLTLSGDSVGYGAFWSPVIEKLSRRATQASSIQITTPFPWYIDEPLQTTLLSSQPNPTLFADTTQLPLREDERLDDAWHGQFWAGTPGWHSLQTDASSLHYYVSEKGGWNSLRQNIQREQNQLVSSASNSSGEPVLVQKELPALYFFLAFVAAAGFLWFAPKL